MQARSPRVWRVVAALIAIWPYRALRPLGALLAFVAFDVLRIRRRHVIASMARAGISDVRVARAAYRSLGAGALELLWLSGRPHASLDSIVHVQGWERFERAHALGRGVVVATAHTGNWDLAACACAERTDLAVVTKHLSSPSLDAFWQSTRARRGLSLIDRGDTVMREIRARLSAGGSVALLVDQDPERQRGVIDAEFLGATALHDTLPATLAARSGAPLVVAFARRLPTGTHVVEVVDVITPPERAGHAFIAEATRAIAASLDRFVRRDPSCWLWLHRRWKTQPIVRIAADEPAAA